MLKSFIQEYQVVGSCNGLICMADALHFNPLIGNFLDLPKAKEHPGREVAFAFGSHLTTKEYKVVQLLYFVNNDHGCGLVKLYFQVFTRGTETWRSFGSFHLSLDQDPSEVLLNWALHLVTTRCKASHLPGPCLRIISFDIAKETVVEIPLPARGSLDICNYNLVVLGQCLSAAVCGSDGSIELWIMKECDVKKSWIKDYVIGAYLPISLSQTAGRPLYSRPWKKSKQSKGAVQVVGTPRMERLCCNT